MNPCMHTHCYVKIWFMCFNLAFLTCQRWVWLSFNHEVTEGQCTNSTGLVTPGFRNRLSPALLLVCEREKERVKECPRVRLGF